MESLSKPELISTITKQADQIKRYETRLRDVVAAYKGLVKEKEALEISLKALNKTEAPVEGEAGGKDDSVTALTLSLATLTAEKSRMEEAFQADKKVTRDKYENMIAGMREETKSLVQQHIAEVNNLKAKIAYEMQERENETANHAAMLKELHIKFNAERKNKEKLEDKYVNSSDPQVTTADLEKRVRDLSGELEAAQRALARASARTCETPALLVRLRDKCAALQQTHALAIREEQIKSKRAEETARKAVARQEERVALLEEKLAELSQTVGEYDARRRKDQQLIQQLKETLNMQLLQKFEAHSEDRAFEQASQKSETDNEKLADSEYLQNLIDKIHILKKELIAENEKYGHPVDIAAILKLDGYENIHTKCREEYENLRIEYESYKKQTAKQENNSVIDSENEIGELKFEVAALKEKVGTYKMLLEQEKQDKVDTLKLHEEKLKSEQEYHKEVISDLKTRVHSLEKQVQTQRDRYAALLQETDNYIRARNAPSRKTSTEEGHGVITDVTSPPHMLHYAHELARKDLDISQLRKEKHILEGHFRDSQRDATIEKERFKEVLRTLKEEIERLRRIQSREGANLEYLKNVVMAYLMSTDYAGRKHMLNAIAAVLHFTDTEKNIALDTL